MLMRNTQCNDLMRNKSYEASHETRFAQVRDTSVWKQIKAIFKNKTVALLIWWQSRQLSAWAWLRI